MSHAAKCEALARELRAQGAPVRLAKDTSNLFRDRAGGGRRRLDVRAFRDVLAVDARAGRFDAEGMVSYEALADACLAQGAMPAVVPQLKTITIGGAVAGVGIEASAHRHGLVHETVEELEVLTAEGEILLCRADNAHADLFHGFPNSYGTLGYALRVAAKAVPVQPYVRIEHLPFSDPAAFFAEIGRRMSAGEADFIDATLFSPERLYLTLGRFAASAPYTSDYTWQRIYYRSIAERREDWLSVRDFLWRWDTDWFWCSKNLYAQNPLVRRLYGRERLGSKTYARLMRWNSRVGLTRALDRLRGLHSESVIQDVDIPLARAAEFLAFYAREIGIWPLWICPIGPRAGAARFALYPLREQPYLNFGFWDVIRTREAREPGHFNRRLEAEVAALGGIKSLYSDSYYSRGEFDRLYGGETYRKLKAKYDPRGVFPDLYEKCVLRG
ncbi:MAG: FAD-binding oxidoreductase [Pseudomonadota bacterium]